MTDLSKTFGCFPHNYLCQNVILTSSIFHGLVLDINPWRFLIEVLKRNLVWCYILQGFTLNKFPLSQKLDFYFCQADSNILLTWVNRAFPVQFNNCLILNFLCNCLLVLGLDELYQSMVIAVVGKTRKRKSAGETKPSIVIVIKNLLPNSFISKLWTL